MLEGPRSSPHQRIRGDRNEFPKGSQERFLSTRPIPGADLAVIRKGKRYRLKWSFFRGAGRG